MRTLGVPGTHTFTSGVHEVGALVENRFPGLGSQTFLACRISYSMVCLSHAVCNDLLFPGVLLVLIVTKSLPTST